MNEKEALRKNILRTATALHNACIKASRKNYCDGCPFKVMHGCDLTGHPIEWADKLQKAKKE